METESGLPSNVDRVTSVFEQSVRFIINLVTNVLIALTVFVCILFTCRTTQFGAFQLHIILCVLGYQFFMCQGILVFSKYNWSMSIKRRYRRHLHWIFQLVALILVLVGSVLMINAKQKNLNTTHGILAICALLLYALSLLNGLLALEVRKLGNSFNPLYVKYAHYVTSIGTLFCATASLVYGFKKRSFKMWVNNDDALYTLMGLTWIFSFFVCLDFWINTTTRIRSMLRQQ